MNEPYALTEDESLYRLGAAIELDGRVSWYPRDARGYAPANSYLLTSPSGALLVDPGLASTEATLVDQLDTLLRPGTPLAVLATRPAELDCIAGTAAVLSSFHVTHVHAPAMNMYHRVGISPRYKALPEEADSSWPLGAIDWNRIAPGDMVAVGESSSARTLEVIRAPLRMVAGIWLYDPLARTLFTSDVFTHVTRSSASASPVLSERESEETAVGAVSANLLAKFDFLQYSNTRFFCDGIAAIVEQRDVEIIAPAYGCVLHGRKTVDRHARLVLSALAALQELQGAGV